MSTYGAERASTPRVAVWTPEQTGAFVDHVTDARLDALYHLVTFRGLRREEAVGLPWAEVDLIGRSLTVREQIVQLGYRTETGPPKSDSARKVVLDEDSVAAIRAHKARQNTERLAWVESGLVFTRENGAALHPSTSPGASSTCPGTPGYRRYAMSGGSHGRSLQSGSFGFDAS